MLFVLSRQMLGFSGDSAKSSGLSRCFTTLPLRRMSLLTHLLPARQTTFSKPLAEFFLDSPQAITPSDALLVQRCLAYLNRLTQLYQRALSQLPPSGYQIQEDPAFVRKSTFEYLLFVWPLCRQSMINARLSKPARQAVYFWLHELAVIQLGADIRATPYANADTLISERSTLAQRVMATPNRAQQTHYLQEVYSSLLLEAPFQSLHPACLAVWPLCTQGEFSSGRTTQVLARQWVSDYLMMTEVTFRRDKKLEQLLRIS